MWVGRELKHLTPQQADPWVPATLLMEVGTEAGHWGSFRDLVVQAIGTVCRCVDLGRENQDRCSTRSFCNPRLLQAFVLGRFGIPCL